LASAKVFVLIEAIDHSLWPSGVEMLLETQGAVALVPLYLKLHPKSKICIVVTNELIQTVYLLRFFQGARLLKFSNRNLAVSSPFSLGEHVRRLQT
jgi:hypothetical protein